MRQTYRVVASLVALGVLVQAASVAFGWFQVLNDVDTGQVFDENSEFNAGLLTHGIVGLVVMPLLGLILVGVSFGVARTVPGARKWAGIVLGLTVLQVGLAFVAFGAPVVGALHGLNALLLFGAAGRAAMAAAGPSGVASRSDSAQPQGSNVPV